MRNADATRRERVCAPATYHSTASASRAAQTGASRMNISAGDVRLKVSGPVSARGLSGATDDRASLSTKGSAPAVSARSLRGRAQCSDERWPDEAQWRNAGGPRSPNQGELRMDRSVSRNTVHKAAARSQGWRLSRLRGECVAAGVQAPDRLVKQKSRATVEGDDRPFPSCCPTCRSSSRTAGL